MVKKRDQTPQVVGWRFWQVLKDGHLASPFAWTDPWHHNRTITARCRWQERHPEQAPPVSSCECGLRVVPDLGDLLLESRRGIGPQLWVERAGLDYYLDRARHGVLRVPDVFGHAIAWGRIEGAYRRIPRPDPVGTLRAEYAKVGRVLYLSSHLAWFAPEIQARYPDAEIRIGTARGLPWLDEIASAEAA